MEHCISIHDLEPIYLIHSLQHGLSLTAKGAKDFAFQLGGSPGDGRWMHVLVVFLLGEIPQLVE